MEHPEGMSAPLRPLQGREPEGMEPVVATAPRGLTTGYRAGKPSAYRSPKSESKKGSISYVTNLLTTVFQLHSSWIFTLFALRFPIQLHRYGSG
jgi:hypothetical protein